MHFGDACTCTCMYIKINYNYDHPVDKLTWWWIRCWLGGRRRVIHHYCNWLWITVVVAVVMVVAMVVMVVVVGIVVSNISPYGSILCLVMLLLSLTL